MKKCVEMCVSVFKCEKCVLSRVTKRALSSVTKLLTILISILLSVRGEKVSFPTNEIYVGLGV